MAQGQNERARSAAAYTTSSPTHRLQKHQRGEGTTACTLEVLSTRCGKMLRLVDCVDCHETCKCDKNLRIKAVTKKLRNAGQFCKSVSGCNVSWCAACEHAPITQRQQKLISRSLIILMGFFTVTANVRTHRISCSRSRRMPHVCATALFYFRFCVEMPNLAQSVLALFISRRQFTSNTRHERMNYNTGCCWNKFSEFEVAGIVGLCGTKRREPGDPAGQQEESVAGTATHQSVLIDLHLSLGRNR